MSTGSRRRSVTSAWSAFAPSKWLPGSQACSPAVAVAVAKARRVAELCGRPDVAIHTGSEIGLRARTEPLDTPSARAIVAEAMRDDTTLPLFVTCGGGLTEIAGAWLLEPRIAERVTLVWIGGHEHDGLADPPPSGTDMEYNIGIDPIAAQVVFDDSTIPVWQVPRSTYRMAIASRSELMLRLRPAGDLGHYLFGELAAVVEMAAGHGYDLGEVFVLGDSPLVPMTALWTAFEPGPASSPSVTIACPRIADSGRYLPRPDGRPLRVFTGVDSRLMLEDLSGKLALLAAGGL